MDFEATLDFVASVGYDADFLRGEARDLIAANPITDTPGREKFEATTSHRGALSAGGPWAARLMQGGGTFIDELAGEATWQGSLDLPASAQLVGEMVHRWMATDLPREFNLLSGQVENLFPTSASDAEQFYSLRDAIQFSEQWLPGAASSRPALTLVLAFCIGVDEFFCPTAALDETTYLGRRLGDLWEECLIECGQSEDAARWLSLARDALRSGVFLQNREKLAHLGVIDQDREVFTDWDTTAHYMLRAEVAMTPFVGFCLCAYAGLPFLPDLIGAVGLYCYGNAFVLDFCKRSMKLGGGSYTEIALQDGSSELQGRSHLIGSLLAYGEDVLPPMFLCILRPFVLATSSVVDVLDRYRERSWGRRLPVNQATLNMMNAVMWAAGANLWDGFTRGKPLCDEQIIIDAIEATDSWDTYDTFTRQPSTEAWYRLPRSVRIALRSHKNRRRPIRDDSSLRSESWMEFLSCVRPPALCPTAQLTRQPARTQFTYFPQCVESKTQGWTV
ncbi:hypothetical protein NLG97_g5109 [Lecanicillium saksenae]|uniref:Uncharacterized protein n=1 Tax=Lecanicillium saksenae TaxID=468837 RepID=A0ACC1QWM1_9HYPO|nr:hypothetical protein NLG97_g5109 [Lecanicillium saksenae]